MRSAVARDERRIVNVLANLEGRERMLNDKLDSQVDAPIK